MEKRTFDRAAEDLGNIVNFGHANFRVPDQWLATLFYVAGLGLTRDPVMMTSVDNMWINAGDSQFHLPTGTPVIAPGIVTGLVVPDLDQLRQRLTRVRAQLEGTRFAFRDVDGGLEATCPWGNRMMCHAPDETRFGPAVLGIAYCEFEIARGLATRIARFYNEIMGALVKVDEHGGERRARVTCGDHQYLFFQEKEAPHPACVDHHIQIYVANFSGPYRRLVEAGIKIEESGQYQYRIFAIPEIETRETLFVLDHEVRSMTHPMYGRPLVNRNAAQTTRDYHAGHDFFAWRRG